MRDSLSMEKRNNFRNGVYGLIPTTIRFTCKHFCANLALDAAMNQERTVLNKGKKSRAELLRVRAMNLKLKADGLSREADRLIEEAEKFERNENHSREW